MKQAVWLAAALMMLLPLGKVVIFIWNTIHNPRYPPAHQQQEAGKISVPLAGNGSSLSGKRMFPRQGTQISL